MMIHPEPDAPHIPIANMSNVGTSTAGPSIPNINLRSGTVPTPCECDCHDSAYLAMAIKKLKLNIKCAECKCHDC